MKDHFTTYEQAVKLKELGFDKKVLAVWHFDGEERNFIPNYGVTFQHPQDIPHWNTSRMWGEHIYSAPRLDQAQAWLREQYGIHVVITPIRQCFYENRCFVSEKHYWNFDLMQIKDGWKPYGSLVEYDSYELALSAGIDAALELLTNKEDRK